MIRSGRDKVQSLLAKQEHANASNETDLCGTTRAPPGDSLHRWLRQHIFRYEQESSIANPLEGGKAEPFEQPVPGRSHGDEIEEPRGRDKPSHGDEISEPLGRDQVKCVRANSKYLCRSRTVQQVCKVGQGHRCRKR
jgi:hypothetical protein